MRAFLVAAAIASVHTPTLDGERTEFPVIDAYGGRVVWSDWDAAAGRWRLMEHTGGEVRAVPVAPGTVPFDIDLGPDGHGGALAVYSRHGRLYSYSFARGRETALGVRGAWPAVWGSRLAFVRTTRHKDRHGRRVQRVYWRVRRGSAPSHRLRLPSPVIAVRMTGPGGTTVERRRLSFAVSELDMRRRRVAYKWDRIDDTDTTHFVYVATTGGRLRAVAPGAAVGGGATDRPRDVRFPALGAHGAVDWLFTNEISPAYFGAFLHESGGGVQASPRTKAAAFAHGARTAYWIDAGPGAAYEAESQPGGTFPLMADGAVAYRPMPRNWLPISPP